MTSLTFIFNNNIVPFSNRNAEITLNNSLGKALRTEEASDITFFKKGQIKDLTGKPIKKSRLQAVPFTRYSLEGQQEVESGQRRGGGKRGKDDLFVERDEDTSRMLTTVDAEE